MKRIIGLLLVGLVISSCGSKKKITEVNKGYEVVKVTENKAVQDTIITKQVDTTKTEIKAKERVNETILEQYIFDAEGTVTGYTRKTDRTIDRDSQTNENKAVTLDVFQNHSELVSLDSLNEIKHDTKKSEKEKKSPNPLWYYIGAGLFVVIVLFFVKKIYW